MSHRLSSALSRSCSWFGTATTDEMLFGIFEYIYDGEAKAASPEEALNQFAAALPERRTLRTTEPSTFT